MSMHDHATGQKIQQPQIPGVVLQGGVRGSSTVWGQLLSYPLLEFLPFLVSAGLGFTDIHSIQTPYSNNVGSDLPEGH